MLLTLRCVHAKDKAMALGLIQFAIGLFGNSIINQNYLLFFFRDCFFYSILMKLTFRVRLFTALWSILPVLYGKRHAVNKGHVGSTMPKRSESHFTVTKPSYSSQLSLNVNHSYVSRHDGSFDALRVPRRSGRLVQSRQDNISWGRGSAQRWNGAVSSFGASGRPIWKHPVMIVNDSSTCCFARQWIIPSPLNLFHSP